MNKIYARQIPPEWQESPFGVYPFPSVWPGVYLTGNRHFRGYTDETFSRLYNRFDGARLLRALQLSSGKKYAARTLQGCCQSDWIICYYPVEEYSQEALTILEAEYFNIGTEWVIHDGDTPPESPEDVEGYSLYVYGSDPRAEISLCTGMGPADVILWEFDGWSRSPRYREAE